MPEELADSGGGLPFEEYGQPPVDIGPLYVPTADYVVLSVNQTLRQPQDGRTIPTIEVGFTVPGVAGQHSILIDNYAFKYADPLRDLRGRASKIRRLYALPTILSRNPEEL